MALPIVFNNTAVNSGFFAENVNGLQGSSFTALELSPETYFFNGTVNAAGDSVVVTDGNGQIFQTLYATNFDDTNHLVFSTNQNGTGFAYAISTQPFTQGQTINFTESSLGDYVVCYVTGTRIRTERGEIAVENLKAGDFAVTASGALRPITWIGHREIVAEAGSLHVNQQPVRVRAGA
ncbi:Hint domain-containing protein, partial [Methylorubrum zatmanii]